MVKRAPNLSLAIVGTGSFGQLLQQQLGAHFRTLLVGRDSAESEWGRVAGCDYVVLAVPLEAYPDTLERLRPHLRPDAILVDVCSVKVKPLEVIKQLLPDQSVLATHPLFGPQSVTGSLAGHTIIVCPQGGQEPVDEMSEAFFAFLGLKVVTMSADEHDQLMADIHGLTFFVARVLSNYGVSERQLITPSYQYLLDLANLDQHHSESLFSTVEQGNSYAQAARHKFVQLATQLDTKLSASE